MKMKFCWWCGNRFGSRATLKSLMLQGYVRSLHAYCAKSRGVLEQLHQPTVGTQPAENRRKRPDEHSA